MSSPATQKIVKLIFARDETTLEEVFAGLAADDATERDIAASVEHGDIVCWTQEMPVQSSEEPPTGTSGIFIVFDGGSAQDSPEVGWKCIPSADPIGVFSSFGAAKAHAESFSQGNPSRSERTFIWEVSIGWYDRRISSDPSP